MKSQVDRRRFLQASGLALAGAGAAATAGRAAEPNAEKFGGRVKKALGYAMIREDLSAEDKLRMVKDIGFEGVEVPTQLLKRNTPEPKVLAQASGGELVSVPQPVVDAIGGQATQVTLGQGGALAWPAMLRKLDRLDSSFRD